MPEPEETRRLDDVLDRAVDRQIAEQRALREVLEELRDGVNALLAAPRNTESAPGAFERGEELHALADRVGKSVDEGVALIEARIRELADLRPDPATPGAPVDAGGIEEAVATMTGTVDGLNSDIEGIARALIDLNDGLRKWADSTEEQIASVRDAIDELGEYSGGDASAPVGDAKSTKRLEGRLSQLDENIDDLGVQISTVEEILERLSGRIDSVGKGVDSFEDHLEGVEGQLKESGELSLYLADQIEDLDRVLTQLRELPERLEGVVTQALKRTLVATAKLEQEASDAVEDAVASFESDLVQMRKSIRSLTDATTVKRVKEMSDAQVKLAARVESAVETMLERIEALEAAQRSGHAELAAAIAKAGGSPSRTGSKVTRTTSKRAPRRKPSGRGS